MKLYLVKKFNKTPYLHAKDLLWLEYIQIITGSNFPSIYKICDLNCGNGKMLSALAALYPTITFTGVCLNADDFKSADLIKSKLNLNNLIFFHTSSIREISKLDILPQNLVYVHDVWNFCDEEDKHHLASLTDAADITIVSYDALPGHASMIPIHHTLANKKNSNRALHYINQHYGGYFQAHPIAGMLINEDMNRYAHPKWHPQSVEQVSQYFTAPLKGEFPIHKNYPYVGMSKEEKDLFATINDPIYFSTMRDYTLNTIKRTDIYANPFSEKAKNFSDLSFGQIKSQKSFPDKSVKGQVTFFYQKPIFQDIFEATKHGFICYADLKEYLPQHSHYELTKSLHELIAGEALLVSALPFKPHTTLSPDFKGKIKFTHPFNEHMCNSTPMEGGVFIIPETKTIIPIKGMECALLQALTKVTLPFAAQICADNYIKDNPKSHLLGKDYKQITSNFLIALDNLKKKYLLKLIEMNVVETLE